MVNTQIGKNSTTIDYGVMTFVNKSKTANFFARFNIPVGSSSSKVSLTTEYIDFTTGESVGFTSLSTSRSLP